MFVQKVIQYIEENQLLTRKDKVLLALSGGADSVALLRILHEEGYEVYAAHCNFHLRGEESDRDEYFVRELCRKWGIGLEVTHFDTAGYAQIHGCSVEMAARELRYSWFEEVRCRVSASVIAVAHHKDDSVETFLLNLLRGTGIKGLRGIQPVNGRIVRPLLEVSRAEILEYLTQQQQDYVTDSTNLEAEYTRNRIRLEILPKLRQINPSVYDSIYETSLHLAEAEKVYRSAVAEACSRIRIDRGVFSIDKLKAEVSPKAVLFELLSPYGFSSSRVEDIYRNLYNGESGRLFYSSDYVLLRDRDVLRLKEKRQAERKQILCAVIRKREEIECGFADRSRAYLDAGKINGDLVLRPWKSGDRFMPFGMKRYKKVRDYLRDRKFSLFEKEKQCVVCAGEEIVWLVNERTDQRFSVTAETEQVLILTVKEDAGN